MLGLSLNHNLIETKYTPTFTAFYTIVKGLFIMLPFIYTERHYKRTCILKYFGKSDYSTS